MVSYNKKNKFHSSQLDSKKKKRQIDVRSKHTDLSKDYWQIIRKKKKKEKQEPKLSLLELNAITNCHVTHFESLKNKVTF